MERVLYYILLKPLSYLPLRVLYILSDLIYLIVYRIIGYRTDVVHANIKNSFPDLTVKEQKGIARRFYHHFCDLLIESLRFFSMPESELRRRLTVENAELLNDYYDDKRSIIIVSGHYNNWELAAIALNAQIKHKVVGIYTPLTNAFFEHQFSKSRTKLGTVLVSKYEVKKYFNEQQPKPVAVVFGTDQSPQHIRDNTYWTTFLNQETAVMYGSEKYAKEFDYPVIFMSISKVKRGYYKAGFSLIEDKPVASDYCKITEEHTRVLEKQIIACPDYYLWTHKRWKHKPPTATNTQP